MGIYSYVIQPPVGEIQQILYCGAFKHYKAEYNPTCAQRLCDSNQTFVFSEIDGDAFVAQALIFILAGFETSASTLSYALYELALHPDLQSRLREEIMQVTDKHQGELTYDSIHEMTYLNMVVSGKGIEAAVLVALQ
jgi:hypothetical protein